MRDFSKQYLSLLQGKFEGLNLTAILGEEDFYNKQILDSVLPLEKSPQFSKAIDDSGVLLDVGFGGGFPLLPLAHRLPHIKFIGVEARKKKVDAVEFICRELSLDNVKVQHLRVEDLLIDCPATVTFKAVGSVQEGLSLITSTAPTKAFFYKGPTYKESEGGGSIPSPWRELETVEYKLPSGDERLIVGLACNRVGNSNKNLVNLTDII